MALHAFMHSERASVADEYALVIAIVVLMSVASLYATGVPFADIASFVKNTFADVAGAVVSSQKSIK